MCASRKLHKKVPHKSYESQSTQHSCDEHEDDVRVCGSLRGRKTYIYRAMIRRNCYEALEKSISNFQGILLCAFFRSLPLSVSVSLSSFCVLLRVQLRLDALLRQKPQETAGET